MNFDVELLVNLTNFATKSNKPTLSKMLDMNISKSLELIWKVMIIRDALPGRIAYIYSRNGNAITVEWYNFKPLFWKFSEKKVLYKILSDQN